MFVKAIHVVVGRCVLPQQACGTGREGSMGKECGPSCNEGSSDCLAQGFRALAGSRLGELADEPCSSFTLTVSYFFFECEGAVFPNNGSPQIEFLKPAPCNMHFVSPSPLRGCKQIRRDHAILRIASRHTQFLYSSLHMCFR